MSPLRDCVAPVEITAEEDVAVQEWTNRFALAALVGFFAGLFALPVACGGFVLVNEHRYGDVGSGGPAAVLGGMGVGLLVGVGVMVLVMRKTRPR